MDFATDLVRERLSSTIEIKNFDCGNNDLNDFILNDALPHQDQLLTITYLYKYQNKTVAFFSVSNDTVSELMFEDKNKFDKFRKSIPRPKRYRILPAVKIGRFGVDKKFEGNGIGNWIMDFIKLSFIHNNKTGCRFITVDAYNNERTLHFYQKNDFEFFTGQDAEHKTRSMYFDLIRFLPVLDTIKNLTI